MMTVMLALRAPDSSPWNRRIRRAADVKRVHDAPGPYAPPPSNSAPRDYQLFRRRPEWAIIQTHVRCRCQGRRHGAIGTFGTPKNVYLCLYKPEKLRA